MSRVVVVGGGVAALAVAARLGAAGHWVQVFEQSDTVGGKLGTFSRDGFTFDTGPSLVTLPEVFRDFFAATGAPLDEVADLVPLDPLCHYRFADGVEFDLPNEGPAAVARAWGQLLGPSAAQDWQALHERTARLWEVTRGPFLESPLAGVKTLLRLAMSPQDVRTVAPWQTLRGLGKSYLRDWHQRVFLDRYATYTGSDPRQAPAALGTVAFVEHEYRGWYVTGGLRRLGDSIAARAVEHGVDITTRSRVSRILVADGGVHGVVLAGGERVEADVVVYAGDSRNLYRDLLPESETRSQRAVMSRVTPSFSGFVLLLALRGRTPGLRHHTVLFPSDYDREFDELFARDPVPCTDPTIYISAPDDPALRPDDDHEAWFVLVNAPTQVDVAEPSHRGFDWTAEGVAENYAATILELMAQRGLEVRDRLLWKEIRTPADLAVRTASLGGSIYGPSSNGSRAAFLRPANRSPFDGLFLVGGSSHPGGGLPLVMMSAKIVADEIGQA
ncbi:NAD(P)/FAD-dependent oxidoreductase [Williamsia sp. CHRR-6]|uniref:phytoene desaturase family protein n=1 Tax=Williamsia sp. CHRR-6 TaxID=2835871 RepID=UPI001BDA24D9|nr:phytoene desaturase family protein [Williamsia sp. CHRR-6]MBT0568690.1 phytoene desaturase [Williamsia sp. CHRR-6]